MKKTLKVFIALMVLAMILVVIREYVHYNKDVQAYFYSKIETGTCY